MIRIDYTLNPSELAAVAKVDLRTASPTQLDYYLFCGDILVRIDEAVVDARWGWVPVLDFAVQLAEVLNKLERDDEAAVAFTESEATIEFRRNGARVLVKAEFASLQVVGSFAELQLAVKDFGQRVIADLLDRWPELTENSEFKKRQVAIEQQVAIV